MIAVSVALSEMVSGRPSIVLALSAINSAPVWTCWRREPTVARLGRTSYAIGPRGHGNSGPVDLSRTTMAGYAAAVIALAVQFHQEPVAASWSIRRLRPG